MQIIWDKKTLQTVLSKTRKEINKMLDNGEITTQEIKFWTYRGKPKKTMYAERQPNGEHKFIVYIYNDDNKTKKQKTHSNDWVWTSKWLPRRTSDRNDAISKHHKTSNWK